MLAPHLRRVVTVTEPSIRHGFVVETAAGSPLLSLVAVVVPSWLPSQTDFMGAVQPKVAIARGLGLGFRFWSDGVRDLAAVDQRIWGSTKRLGDLG